jgi:hypothetical protein
VGALPLFYKNVYFAVFIDFEVFPESHFERVNVHASNCRPRIYYPVEVLFLTVPEILGLLLSP